MKPKIALLEPQRLILDCFKGLLFGMNKGAQSSFQPGSLTVFTNFLKMLYSIIAIRFQYPIIQFMLQTISPPNSGKTESYSSLYYHFYYQTNIGNSKIIIIFYHHQKTHPYGQVSVLYCSARLCFTFSFQFFSQDTHVSSRFSR